MNSMLRFQAMGLRFFWVSLGALSYSSAAWSGIPIEHWTQSTGVQVYLVQSQTISMVDLQVDFDAGSRRDPVAQAGLASVVAAMMSKGLRADGAEPALDENQLGEAWADLGAHFGAGASGDRMSFNLRSLTYPDLLHKAIGLAARQMGAPAFPNEVWQRERSRLQAAIKEANTRPTTLAARAFSQAVYGDHPYGYEMTEISLDSIAVTDMLSLYARLILPCRARVSIVGAVTRPEADALVKQLFSRLPKTLSCPVLSPVVEVQPLLRAEVKTIAFDSAQAQVLIGQPGYKRNDPDFFALLVGNYILGGGGFVSRLTEEVREKRGLSYSVYSYFSPGLHAGAFTLGLQTRPDQAQQALQVVHEVLRHFVREGPNPVELQAAKDNLIGGFALRIDSNRKLLDNVANMAWNQLKLDYLDNWTSEIGKITVSDIRLAFARKLQPEKMVTVVLGGSGK